MCKSVFFFLNQEPTVREILVPCAASNAVAKNFDDGAVSASKTLAGPVWWEQIHGLILSICIYNKVQAAAPLAPCYIYI